MSHRYGTKKGCCRCVRDYVSYAVSVAGRRILTLLDVATDMRTFFILWNDPNTVVIACFLLASISAPLLVYWASSHNFNEAIMAHKTFGERRPRNCRERCHRNFYNAVAVPLVGVYLTSLQVIFWWLSDIFLSIFCQSYHRQEVSRLEQREFCKRDRSMPLIMPSESARFMAIVELSYESIPQTILQLWVYFWHASSYYTLFDVCISVGASLANMVFNMVEILYAARTRSMYFTDYLLYFMSGQIDDMLCSGVPVRRALRNTCEECDISGFHTLYTSPEAIRNLRLNLESMTGISTKVNGIKRFILPEVPQNMTWTLSQFEEIVKTVLALRRHADIRVTLPKIKDDFMHEFICAQFQQESNESLKRRGKQCNVRAARRCNRIFGCCGTRPGDVVCATNTRVLGEKEGGNGFCCALRVRVRDPLYDMRQRVLWLFKHLDKDKEITSRVVRHTVEFLIIGDLSMVKHVNGHLVSEAMKMVFREVCPFHEHAESKIMVHVDPI